MLLLFLLPHDRSSLVSHFQLVLGSFKGCSSSHTRSNILSGRKREDSNFVPLSFIPRSSVMTEPRHDCNMITDLSINHSLQQNPPKTTRRTPRPTVIVKHETVHSVTRGPTIGTIPSPNGLSWSMAWVNSTSDLPSPFPIT